MFEQNETQQYIDELLQVTKTTINVVGSDKELLSGIAKFTKNMHEAYIEAGFSYDEAFELISKSDVLKMMGNNK